MRTDALAGLTDRSEVMAVIKTNCAQNSLSEIFDCYRDISPTRIRHIKKAVLSFEPRTDPVKRVPLVSCIADYPVAPPRSTVRNDSNEPTESRFLTVVHSCPCRFFRFSPSWPQRSFPEGFVCLCGRMRNRRRYQIDARPLVPGALKPLTAGRPKRRNDGER